MLSPVAGYVWYCVDCVWYCVLVGGYAAHSLAIMTDAAHLLTDFGSVLISLFSLWISSRPPSKHLTFGWHRSGVCGSFSLLDIYTAWPKKKGFK